jgi:hypothetical protein
MASRSPNYPTIGLGAALSGAQKIWNEEKRSAFPATVAVRHLGFTSVNGTSRGHLAALKHYGLIKDQDGQNFVVTPLAIRIMAHPEVSPERLAAMREAALAPKLFKELYQSYREASDATISAYLITNRSFGDDGAKRAIKSFRETIKVAKLDVIDEMEGQQHDGDQNSGDQAKDSSSIFRSPAKHELARALASKTASDLAALGVSVPDLGRILRFSIARDSEAQITFTGPITQEAIEKLSALLELQKDTFPTKAELEDRDVEGE